MDITLLPPAGQGIYENAVSEFISRYKHPLSAFVLLPPVPLVPPFF